MRTLRKVVAKVSGAPAGLLWSRGAPRGGIWWADLVEPHGSKPAKRRAVLVIQSGSFNAYSGPNRNESATGSWRRSDRRPTHADGLDATIWLP